MITHWDYWDLLDEAHNNPDAAEAIMSDSLNELIFQEAGTCIDFYGDRFENVTVASLANDIHDRLLEHPTEKDERLLDILAEDFRNGVENEKHYSTITYGLYLLGCEILGIDEDAELASNK